MLNLLMVDKLDKPPSIAALQERWAAVQAIRKALPLHAHASRRTLLLASTRCPAARA